MVFGKTVINEYEDEIHGCNIVNERRCRNSFSSRLQNFRLKWLSIFLDGSVGEMDADWSTLSAEL